MSVADKYKLINYETLPSNNLYAFVFERSVAISMEITRLGMIVPVSSVSSDGFLSLQKIMLRRLITWVSSYSNRPGKLFENVEQRLTIVLSKNMKTQHVYIIVQYISTGIHRKDWLYLIHYLTIKIINRIQKFHFPRLEVPWRAE